MTDFIAGLLELGAEESNGVYWLDAAQFAILLDQAEGLSVFYDPDKRSWFSVVPDAPLDDFVQAINATVHKRLQSKHYDYKEFQIVVCGRYPSITDFVDESDVFHAIGDYVHIHYHPNSGTWEAQTVVVDGYDGYGAGQTLAEAIRNLVLGDDPQ